MSRQRPLKSHENVVPPDERTSIVGNSSTTASERDATQVATNTDSHSVHRKRKNIVKIPSFLGRFGAIELENKGSVARDHLALERTFLAWLRTSLAFASIGIAVTQLFRLNSALQTPNPTVGNNVVSHMGKSLGATFLGISIIVLAFGAQRYYESQSWLLKGKFPASRGSIFAIALISLLLIVASLVIVLIARPNTTET